MDEKNYRKLVITTMSSLSIVCISIIIYLIFSSVIYFLPLIISIILYLFMEPIVKLLINKLKISRKTASIISLVFLLLTFGSIITLIISKIISELKSLSVQLPEYILTAKNNIELLTQKTSDLYKWMPHNPSIWSDSLWESLANTLKDMLKPLLQGALSTAVNLPSMIIFAIVTLITTYFISSDKESIINVLSNIFPNSLIKKAVTMKNDMFSAFFGYIRSQIIIMFLTLTQLIISFLIIGVKHPFVVAVFISLVDALPILGAGIILFPWAIYNFLIGNYVLGFSLLVVSIITLIIRHTTEPKILSTQIGVHPLITITSMYAGLKIWGMLGLAIGPTIALLIQNILIELHKEGYFRKILSFKKK